MLPTAGVIDQTTAVFELFATAAVNVCVCDGDIAVTPPEESETLTLGANIRLVLADFVGSATLVAVTTTVCQMEFEAGAV